ncbi:MAG: hypothetical protein AAF907_06135, partial [Planctomycetota bacterium]
WYPSQWYGLPGSQKPRVAPQVFMPTDTTQLGYYHQHVPTWQPVPPSTWPMPPDPRTIHHYEQAGGPNIGVYPGHYLGEPRVHGHHGGIHDPVTGSVIYGDMTPVPAAPIITPGTPVMEGEVIDSVPTTPEVISEPLPSSTEPLPGAPAPAKPLPSEVIPPAPEA